MWVNGKYMVHYHWATFQMPNLKSNNDCEAITLYYSILPRNLKFVDCAILCFEMLFNLFLSDIEGPVIVNCPSDQTGDTDDGSPTGTVTWTPPTTTDNSGIVSLTSSHLPGDILWHRIYRGYLHINRFLVQYSYLHV